MGLFGKSKTERIRTQAPNVDDFDGFNDDPFAEINENSSPDLKNPKSRNPVLSAASGVKQGIVSTATDPNFLRDTLQKALPAEASYTFETVDKVSSGLRRIYDDTTKELKPHIKDITKRIDRLIPAEAASLKKLTSKVAGFFGDEGSGYAGPSKQEAEDQSIANTLSSVFAAQAQSEMAIKAHDQARENVREAIGKKRHDDTMTVTTAMSQNIARFTSYTDTINQAWQKKILEVQYRQLFVQTDTFKNLEKYNEIFRVQQESIVKNTALPEFAKIHQSERFKEIMRDKLMDSITSAGFLSGSTKIIETGLKKAGYKISEVTSQIKQTTEAANMSLDMVESTLETEKSMAEAGMSSGGGGLSGLAGSLMGAAFTKFIGDEVAKEGRSQIDKSPKTKLKMMKLFNFFTDINSGIRDLSKNEKLVDHAEHSSGPLGWLAKKAIGLLDLFTVEPIDTSIKSYNGSVAELAQPAIFDNRTYRTINEVIPGYLARINAELYMANLYGGIHSKAVQQGGKLEDVTDNHLSSFNFKKGRIESASSVRMEISSKLDKYTDGTNKSYMDDVATKIIGSSYSSMSENDKIRVRNILMGTVVAQNDSVTPSSILSSGRLDDPQYASSQDQINAIKAGLKVMSDPKDIYSQSKTNEFYTSVNRAKQNSSTPNRFINEIVNEYGKDAAERMGIIRMNDSGEIEADKFAMTRMLFRQAGAISDESSFNQELGMKHGLSFIDASDQKLNDKLKSRKTFILARLNTNSFGVPKTGEYNKINNAIGDLTPEQLDKAAADLEAKYGTKKTSLSNILKIIEDSKLATSDINKKTNIRPTKNIDYLEAIKKTKVFSWNYKSTADAYNRANGRDAKTGPMAQDVRENMGESAAPNGKAIDLVHMNGITMGAIQQLSEKIENGSNRVEELHILKGMHRYLKVIAHQNKLNLSMMLPSSQLSSLELQSRGIVIDPTKYSSINKGAMKGTADLAFLAGKDLVNGTTKALSFGKNSVLDPAIAGLKKGYLAAKDPVWKTLVWGKDKAVEGMGKVAEGLGDLASKVPKALQWGSNKLRDAKDWVIRNTFMEDLYIEGKFDAPALRAKMLQAGEYFDEQTGKVIKSLSDIKGNIVDSTGKLVLSVAEYKNGFYNRNGKRIKEFASNLWNKAKDAASKLKDGISGLVSGSWDFLTNQLKPDSFLSKIMNGIGSMFGGALGFGWNKKIYNVLLDIRDILRHKSDIKSQRSDSDEQETEKSDRAFKISNKKAKRSIDRLLKKARGAVSGIGPQEQNAATNTEAMYSRIIGKVTNYRTITKAPVTIDDWADVRNKLAKGYSVNIKIDEFESKDNAKAFEKTFKDVVDKDLPVVDNNYFHTGTTLKSAAQTNLKKITDKLGSIDSSAKAKEYASDIFGKIGSKFKRKRNDTDGDGKADGSVDEVLENKSRIKGLWEKGKSLLSGKSEAKEKDSGGKFGILGLLTGAMGTIGKFVSTIPVLGTVFSLLKGITSIGGGALKLGGALARIGVTVAGKAAMGILSSAGGAIAGLALANPIGASVALAAIAGGAIYYVWGKDIKAWLNRDEHLKALRFAQYGFTDNGQDNKEYFSKLIDLETYMLDGRIIKDGTEIKVKKDSIDTNKVLEMMGIDRRSDVEVNNFATWFHKRFKPFLLAHIRAMDHIKVKQFDKISEQPEEARNTFLNYAQFLEGPYDISTSPFATKPSCDNTREHVKNLVEVTKQYWRGSQSFLGRAKRFFGFDTKLNKLQDKANSTVSATQEKGKTYAQNRADVVQATKEVVYRDAANKYLLSQDPVAEDSGGEVAGAWDTASSEDRNNRKAAVGSMRTNMYVAKGKLHSAEGAERFVNVARPSMLNFLNPEVKRLFLGMAAEYNSLTDKSITINDGYRSYEEQLAVFKKYGSDPNRAARPGTSMHEFGLAIDIPSAQAKVLEELGLMRKYGFTRPVGREPWHIEPAGIQQYIKSMRSMAKDNPSRINEIVAQSVNRGGGGIGTIPNSPKGRNLYIANIASGPALQVKEIDLTPEEAKKIEGAQDTAAARVASMQAQASASPAGKAASLSEAQITNLKKIEDYAKSTGEDPAKLGAKVLIESSLGTNTVNPNSSATGMTQILKGTAKSLVSNPETAAALTKAGVDIRNYNLSDPTTNLKFNTVLKNDNINRFKRLFPSVQITDEIEYLIHNLGMGNGKTFFKAVAEGKLDIPVSSLLSSDVIAGNPTLYKVSGNVATVRQVLANAKRMVGNATATVSKYLQNQTAPASTPATSVAQASAARVYTPAQMQAAEDTRRQEANIAMSESAPASGFMKTSARAMPNASADTSLPAQQFKSMVDTLIDSNKIHHLQLTAAVETKAILEQLLKSLSPEALKELQKNMPTAPKTEPPKKRTEPVVNMGRTMV